MFSITPSKEQWEQLYVENSPVLYNYGCKLTAQTSLVEDCIHDVFFSLWKMRDRLAEIRHPKAYLIRCFRRLLLQKLQENARINRLALHSQEPEFHLDFSSEATLIQAEVSSEQLQMLKNALLSLYPRQREAIYLKFYESHSYDEVADIMKLEKSALYTLIYKALNSLRKALRHNSAPQEH